MDATRPRVGRGSPSRSKPGSEARAHYVAADRSSPLCGAAAPLDAPDARRPPIDCFVWQRIWTPAAARDAGFRSLVNWGRDWREALVNAPWLAPYHEARPSA